MTAPKDPATLARELLGERGSAARAVWHGQWNIAYAQELWSNGGVASDLDVVVLDMRALDALLLATGRRLPNEYRGYPERLALAETCRAEMLREPEGGEVAELRRLLREQEERTSHAWGQFHAVTQERDAARAQLEAIQDAAAHFILDFDSQAPIEDATATRDTLDALVPRKPRMYPKRKPEMHIQGSPSLSSEASAALGTVMQRAYRERAKPEGADQGPQAMIETYAVWNAADPDACERKIRADGSPEAAETWAALRDHESTEYTIAKGDAVQLFVRAPSGKVSKYEVVGVTRPQYETRKLP